VHQSRFGRFGIEDTLCLPGVERGFVGYAAWSLYRLGHRQHSFNKSGRMPVPTHEVLDGVPLCGMPSVATDGRRTNIC
jgi:hypothetical protein